MTNLIARARSLNPEYLYGELVHELADEIERLREALKNIYIGGIGERRWTIDEMRAYALHEYQETEVKQHAE